MQDVNKVSLAELLQKYHLEDREWGLPLLKSLSELQSFAAGPIGRSMPLVTFIPVSRDSLTTFGVGGLATASEVEEVGWNNILGFCKSAFAADNTSEPIYAASMMLDSLFMLGIEPVICRRVVILTRDDASGGWRRTDSQTMHWDDDLPDTISVYRELLFTN